MSKKYKLKHIVGLDDTFIDYQTFSVPVHREIVKAFLALQSKAAASNFQLTIVSGFRSFERQLLIWNEKAQGIRAVLDRNGEPIDLSVLDPWDQVQAILRWSALPGTSRHHWGTDIDVYDSAAVESGYSVQLTVEEVANDGLFGPMHLWLDRQIILGRAEGFVRPYDRDRGGIAPERWHLSYAPLAMEFEELLSVETLRSLLDARPLLLKEPVLLHLDEIFARYVVV